MQIPFPQLNSIQATLAILRHQRPSHYSARHQIPVLTWDIMELCWNAEPSERPTAPHITSKLRRSLRPATPLTHRHRLSTELNTSGRYSQLSGNESASTSRPESDGPRLSTREKIQQSRATASARSTPLGILRPGRIMSPIPRPGTAPIPHGGPSSSVRGIASVFPGANRLVPQFIYKPTVAYLTRIGNVEPIIFYVKGPRGCGINCVDARNGWFGDLTEPDAVVACNPHMQLRHGKHFSARIHIFNNQAFTIHSGRTMIPGPKTSR